MTNPEEIKYSNNFNEENKSDNASDNLTDVEIIREGSEIIDSLNETNFLEDCSTNTFDFSAEFLDNV